MYLDAPGFSSNLVVPQSSGISWLIQWSTVFLPILGSVVYMHVLLDCVLTELVNGLFTLNMVAYTLCWYPAEQVALRFLLWTVVAPKFLLMLAVLGLPRVRLIAYVFDMVLFYCVQISGRWGGAIGGPRDVSWLSAEQRTMYAKTTAAGTLAVKTGRAMWRRKRVGRGRRVAVAWVLTVKQSSIKYAQPLVVLGASLLHTLSTGLDTMEFWWHVSPEAAVVLTMVVLVLAVMFVGRVSSRFPSALCKCYTLMANDVMWC